MVYWACSRVPFSLLLCPRRIIFWRWFVQFVWYFVFENNNSSVTALNKRHISIAVLACDIFFLSFIFFSFDIRYWHTILNPTQSIVCLSIAVMSANGGDIHIHLFPGQNSNEIHSFEDDSYNCEWCYICCMFISFVIFRCDTIVGGFLTGDWPKSIPQFQIHRKKMCLEKRERHEAVTEISQRHQQQKPNRTRELVPNHKCMPVCLCVCIAKWYA